MRSFLRVVVSLVFALSLIQSAGAVTINYDLIEVDIESNRWQYTYTISNDFNMEIGWFAIYFDYDLYDGLVLGEEQPSNWMVELEVIDSIYGENYPGAMVATWAPSRFAQIEEFEVFSVSFYWLGPDPKPGAQLFEVSDFYENIITMDFTSGNTPEVPEPQTLILLGTGLLGLAAYYRKKRGRKSDKLKGDA